jgi:hypothetical protein
MEHGNAIKEFVDKKVDALIKAIRETESIELVLISVPLKKLWLLLILDLK